MKLETKNQIRDLDTKVSRNLRNFRKQLGINQRDVADTIGVSVQQIQKYENGVNRISIGKLYMIASLFKMRVNNFFTDDMH